MSSINTVHDATSLMRSSSYALSYSSHTYRIIGYVPPHVARRRMIDRVVKQSGGVGASSWMLSGLSLRSGGSLQSLPEDSAV